MARNKSAINMEEVRGFRQVEGRNAVRELLRSGNKVERMFVEIGMKYDDKLKEIYDLASRQSVQVEKILPKKLNKMSKTDGHHQGIIAFAQVLEEKTLRQVFEEIITKKEKPLFIILSGVLYEHNLGAVLRSAESAGAHAVIVSNRSIGLSPVVSRTAVGASEYMPLIHDNLFSVMKFLKKEDIKIVAASEKADKVMYKADFNRGLAIIVGEENMGISESYTKYIDEEVRIPMYGQIGSLNMSVAGALLMFEVVRQRKFSELK